MTEAEWLSCTDPAPMLAFLRGKARDRKLHLFILSCYRRYWFFRFNDIAQRAAEVLERYADNTATAEELKKTRRGPEMNWMRFKDLIRAATTMSEHVASHQGQPSAYTAERSLQSSYLRDIFPFPFHSVSLDSRWLAPPVRSMATAAYEERALPSGELDTTRLSVLADALEDAGCSSADLLAHLRSPGPHVRGCWAVDTILDKT
jgi:hypothetical protein